MRNAIQLALIGGRPDPINTLQSEIEAAGGLAIAIVCDRQTPETLRRADWGFRRDRRLLPNLRSVARPRSSQPASVTEKPG
jgi:hypothetical protein